MTWLTTSHRWRRADRLLLSILCASAIAAPLVVAPPNVAAGPCTGRDHSSEPKPAGEGTVDAVSDDLTAALAAVRADEDRRIDVFAQAAKAVVCVFEDPERGGGGSGVIFDPEGYGLTNYHVVQPFIKSRRGYGALADGRLYPLKVLGIDPGGDIVMFKLEGRERFDHAPLGDSDTLRVGQPVAAMGNPFVLAEDNRPTITLGVISGLHRYQEGQGNVLEYADCIQVSTSINPGNSGGPLFDLEGRVIGINGRASFQDEKGRHRVNVGLGYAVSINQIKRFMPGLRAGRLLEHGTLGATVRAAGGDLIVSAIQAFSPAENAGVQLGDELLEVAGRRVHTANDYNNIMAMLPADWPVTLKLLSNGQMVEKTARLERLPLRMQLLYVLDLDHNQAELARILDAGAARMHTRLAEPFSSVTFAAHMRSEDGRLDEELELLVTPERGRTDDEASQQPAKDESLVKTLCAEWQDLALPLLARPHMDLQWEFLGGDEVAGHIVNVIEQRLRSDRRLRWKFDWETSELLALTIGEQHQPEAVVWLPTEPTQFGDLVWPRKWVRSGQAGGQVVIEIDAITPTPAAPPVPTPDVSSEEAAE